MNEQENLWFDALTCHRSKGADILEEDFLSGVTDSVMNKYTDQAHFIYELLQNADDVKATSARFRLEKGGLFFIHNGTIRFTVSDPKSEHADKKSGALGHINAITSIGNSSKKGEVSIGKFGIGFKAVFQYSQTPHIYDPKIRFKIERFIVPYILDADLDWREPQETVFWFPFNHKVKTPEASFDDVLEKLKALDLPILFLSHLKSVEFEGNGVSGKYTKKVTHQRQQGDIAVQQLALTMDLNGELTTHILLVFTRKGDNRLPFCIGYALKNNKKIVPINRPAFCFFPTKVTTNLNFIIHAPFLLTDSREGIKAGDKYNQELVQLLAQLAADSLPILRDEKLIDDCILEIIPYDEGKFSELDDRSRNSFKPFYTVIKEKLQTDTLLPAANGKCSSKSRSYWASDTKLVELFSDKQLAQLTGTKDAHWVFRSRGKEEVQSVNKVLDDYIDGSDDARSWIKPNLIVSSLDPKAVLKRINSKFIAVQSHKWLHKFYHYLSKERSYCREIVKSKPIFLDQNGNAVPAFDELEQPILFLPDDDIEGYTTINNKLLSNKTTREFIEKFGVKKPSLRDEIYNKIFPAYEGNETPDVVAHFKKFFRYFKKCGNEDIVDFIDLIKDKDFLLYKTAKKTGEFRGKAEDIYLPATDLKAWFKTKPDTKFLSLDKYHKIVGKKNIVRLMEFFQRLGVAKIPRVIDSDSDKQIDGLDELLSKIDAKRSVTLWRMLVESWSNYESSMRVLVNYYGPRGGKRYSEYRDSSSNTNLRTKEWIVNKDGELVSADAVTIQSLSDKYDITSAGAEALIRFLEIHNEEDDTSHLSEEESRKIKLANVIEQSGLSDDEIRDAIEEAKRKKATPPQKEKEGSKNKQAVPGSPLIDEIQCRRPSVKNSNTPSKPGNPPARPSDESEDSDDYTPKVVDYGKKLDRAKDRYANELDRIEREQTLLDIANKLPRYSYGWLLALLELECMASSEKNADGKTISISFGKVERDDLSSRTIVLKEPNRFIPQSIEEFSGVRVDLDFGNGSRRELRVDSFTAKEFSLLGKLESADDLNGIDLDKVIEARIEIQNPSFLLEELLERFRELKFEDNFDMKAELTPIIEFVFGPPGTGKTTHLAVKVLIPRMRATEKARVLVLTPTNKAADVLTNRIMEEMGGDTSYLDWLIRFGTSADERIEKAGVWRDRSFNIDTLERSVTITTIARFAYDGFEVQYGSKKLHEVEWDAIVIDEASMIPLASIIYPLYQQKPKKFIVAGDPFQIEPIVAVEQWKDENIYTLVGLNKAGSFANPATEPHDYPITNLETQFRSIPAIGEVFSRFTYNGILKHHRKAGEQLSLKLNGFDVKSLNLIKFPVSKYESIYRAKRLESGTPYQTYSALFTFEFVRWLAGQIHRDREVKVRIGVIAPYRAQANLLNKLNDSWVTKPDAVEIQVGTIHGFQGDECDIIIAIFNPPPNISSNPRMFLNKQNILNVAISRARDYLFIVMPDDETEGVKNLYKITKIEKLVKAGGAFSEYVSHAIEKLIWGKTNYLEENTFSTGHQMVNIYRKPERYYEVRSDNSAIDVQIHEKYQDELE